MKVFKLGAARSILLVLSAFGMAAATTQPAIAAGAAAKREATKLLSEVVEQDGGSGGMAAVLINGRLVWSAATGFADTESQILLRRDHKLRIGSVSKPITAALALKLAQAGVLDIDKPVRTYLPGFPEKQAPITLRQLGAHTSGVRHYDFSNYFEANNVLYYPELAGALEAFKDDTLLHTPGEKFEYSSLGFNLIGAAIEAATGSSFGAVLDQYVAAPLSLSATQVNDPMEIIAGRARFYTVTMANPVMTWMKDGALINTIFRDDSDLYPSGGLLSNADDLARFADAVFNSDFLGEAEKRVITTPAVLNDGAPVEWSEGGAPGYYSFGWGVFPREDGKVLYYGHGGETNGAYALIRYYPEHKMAVAGIVNYNMVSGDTSFFKRIGDELPTLFMED